MKLLTIRSMPLGICALCHSKLVTYLATLVQTSCPRDTMSGRTAEPQPYLLYYNFPGTILSILARE